jgi:hypothetical protein
MSPGGRVRAGRRRLNGRFVLLLAVLVLALGLVKLAEPLATVRHQSGHLAQLKTQKAALLAHRARLQERKAELATQPGQEAAVRRRGYVRPGERRLVFVPEERAQAQPAAEGINLPPDS